MFVLFPGHKHLMASAVEMPEKNRKSHDKTLLWLDSWERLFPITFWNISFLAPLGMMIYGCV